LSIFQDWLVGIVSAAVGFFILRFAYLQNKLGKYQKENVDLRLKEKESENAEMVRKENAGKSDADIVRDAIKRGQ
jgi:hypothetical protein